MINKSSRQIEVAATKMIFDAALVGEQIYLLVVSLVSAFPSHEVWKLQFWLLCYSSSVTLPWIL